MKNIKLSLLLLSTVFALQTFTTNAMFSRIMTFGKNRSSLYKPQRRAFGTENNMLKGTKGDAVIGTAQGILGCLAAFIGLATIVDSVNNYYFEKDRANYLKAAETGNALEVQRGFMEARDKYDNTAMHLAARNGHLNVVQLLDKKTHLWNSKNNVNRTPIHEAAAGCHSSLVNYFKSKYGQADGQAGRRAYEYATIADSMGKTPADYLAQCPKK